MMEQVGIIAIDNLLLWLKQVFCPHHSRETRVYRIGKDSYRSETICTKCGKHVPPHSPAFPA